MKIVGCDLHTRYQQIAMLDTETGELIERRLEHANGEPARVSRGLDAHPHLALQAGVESAGQLAEIAALPHGSPSPRLRTKPAFVSAFLDLQNCKPAAKAEKHRYCWKRLAPYFS